MAVMAINKLNKVKSMRQLSRYIPHAIVIAFAAWCLISLRGDVAQLTVEPLIRSWGLVVLALLLSLLNYLLRILRWRSYLARLGSPLSFRFAALSYCAGFAYTVSPGKVGEMVRARYYLPLGVPLSDVTAAFFSERLLDLLSVTALAALLFTASTRYVAALVGAVALIVVALGAIAILPWAGISARLKSAASIPAAIRSVLAGIASALAATRTLLRPRVLVTGFAIGLLAWGLEGAGLGLLSTMFSTPQLHLTTAIGIYGIGMLLGGLSLLPGGLGGTEAVMTALLVTTGFSVSQALLLTLTCRLVTLWFAVCLGWIAVFILRQRVTPVVLPWR
jgi:glycosyltransferase 2 family protein